MKLHHTKYKENYKRYILDNLHEVDWNGKTLTTDEEIIEYIFERISIDYAWRAEQVGELKAMTEWLAGLALNLPYQYDEIVELAIAMGSIDENPSEKLQDKIVSNEFEFMANIILGFKSKRVKQLN